MRSRRLILLTAVVLAAIASITALRLLARSRTFQLFGDLVARVDTRDSVVALTFDDGPVASLADSLATRLGDRGARATFFVIGRELAGAPAAARTLMAAGHELGNHSWSHPHFVFVAPSTVRSEVESTDSLIRVVGYRGPIHFRPPYSVKLVALPFYLWRTGRTTIMCDIEPDSYPEVAASADRIVAHVLERVRPGSIILLHPWYPSRATSRAAIAPLVDSLQSRGYRLVTVSELLARRSPTPRAASAR